MSSPPPPCIPPPHLHPLPPLSLRPSFLLSLSASGILSLSLLASVLVKSTPPHPPSPSSAPSVSASLLPSASVSVGDCVNYPRPPPPPPLPPTPPRFPPPTPRLPSAARVACCQTPITGLRHPFCLEEGAGKQCWECGLLCEKRSHHRADHAQRTCGPGRTMTQSVCA